ncbi:biopolymer transporter ExbD [Dysgonomonas sp. 520]|uniref:ExbD/TolR family protein n=1 Tax=Dysgonomonas sp. 520 TaxID=2302931 RepID=UPI0013D1A95C|nr:biopolymer transporter ExbD [Dysgonomonas sp. 520]NDW11104.1 biopolymer transporter ExbD [Dysgonomonas sp. 520]
MANLDTGGGEAKKGKPKKQTLRVDFTPMVDMNMLLITFFMFCTTLSKPQTMDIVLPTKDNAQMKDEDKTKVKESSAITVILGENDKIYCYEGQPDYENWQSVREMNYSGEGDQSLRNLLLGKNEKIVKEISKLKNDRYRKAINEEQFKEKSAEIKKDKDAPVVIIKPTDGSTYKNMVDVLDEMQICSIGRYAVVDMGEADSFLVQNYMEKGALSAQAAPKK